MNQLLRRRFNCQFRRCARLPGFGGDVDENGAADEDCTVSAPLEERPAELFGIFSIKFPGEVLVNSRGSNEVKPKWINRGLDQLKTLPL